MTEAILAVIIILLILLHVWYINKYHELQQKLVKALLSKDVHEYTSAVLAEKKVKKEKPKDPELVPVNEMSDDEFSRAIKEQLKDG